MLPFIACSRDASWLRPLLPSAEIEFHTWRAHTRSISVSASSGRSRGGRRGDEFDRKIEGSNPAAVTNNNVFLQPGHFAAALEAESEHRGVEACLRMQRSGLSAKASGLPYSRYNRHCGVLHRFRRQEVTRAMNGGDVCRCPTHLGAQGNLLRRGPGGAIASRGLCPTHLARALREGA